MRCLSQHSVSNVLFDVMIDRLHDVALTVGSPLHFTRAAVKLFVYRSADQSVVFLLRQVDILAL